MALSVLSRLGDCVVVVAVADHRGIVGLLQIKLYLRMVRLLLLPVHDEADVGLRQVYGGRVPGVADQPGANRGLDGRGALELDRSVGLR